jgi:hypothetical protein
VIPIGNGGTGSNVQNFVDLNSTQLNIAGDKGFTTSLHYGAFALPTDSKFGTSEQTILHLKGGGAIMSEASFNNSHALLINNEVNSGTQRQTANFVAAGNDGTNGGSEFIFKVRQSGASKNWGTVATFHDTGKTLLGNANSTIDATLCLGPYTSNTSGDVAIHFTQGNWRLAAVGGSESFQVKEGATTRAHITSGSSGWLVGSDYRLKEDITVLSVLPYVNSFRGVSYKLKSNPKENRNIGVIAQEIEECFPEAVFTDETEDKMKSVSYNAIASIALQGVKELYAYIQQLEERIKQLEK